MSGKIIGLGGIFFKSPDQKKLIDWYRKMLDLEMEDWGISLPIQEVASNNYQVFSVFPESTSYFADNKLFMINLMVDDLDAFLDKLRSRDIPIISQETIQFGKFAWILDLDGNKLELWEPVKSDNN
jgi:predicted enzyme related to lactoylglutathione lyase